MEAMKITKIIGYDQNNRRTFNEVMSIKYKPISKIENNENFNKLFKKQFEVQL